jgi:serine/threonine-protein phosphatase PGAM5
MLLVSLYFSTTFCINSTATDANHPRIEEAFRKYFYRAPFPEDEVDPAKDENALASTEKDAAPEEERHEFEIIVCHANVIRYFLCR